MTKYHFNNNEWLVFEQGGLFAFCTRLERECFIMACKNHGVTDFGIVLKTFYTKNEALNYCKKINKINDLVNKILSKNKRKK